MKEDIDEAFVGTFDNVMKCRPTADETMEIPDHIAGYFDYEGFARDLNGLLDSRRPWLYKLYRTGGMNDYLSIYSWTCNHWNICNSWNESKADMEQLELFPDYNWSKKSWPMMIGSNEGN